jgi:predicted translin family RNA/ssDNA-binding protein
MATPIEVYNSICEAIQKSIDKLNNDDIALTEEQVAEIVKHIGRLNKQLEEYSRRYLSNK